MKYKVLLSLGSNKGNRKENLEKAIIQIQNLLGDVIAISSIYESPSWGYKDEAYLNNAICLVTDVAPIELMDALLNIENSLGLCYRREFYRILPYLQPYSFLLLYTTFRITFLRDEFQ